MCGLLVKRRGVFLLNVDDLNELRNVAVRLDHLRLFEVGDATSSLVMRKELRNLRQVILGIVKRNSP